MPDESCVHKTNGEAEAQQIKALLEANDIPCVLRGESVRMTHGFTLDGLGVVRICVPPELADRARELIAAAEAGDLRLGPDEGT